MRVDPRLEYVVEEGDQRSQREGRDEESDEAELNDKFEILVESESGRRDAGQEEVLLPRRIRRLRG